MTDKEKKEIKTYIRDGYYDLYDFDISHLPNTIREMLFNNIIDEMDELNIDTKEFDDTQLTEICRGLIEGLTKDEMTLYANPKFDSDQMRDILDGLLNIDISYNDVVSYADEKYDADQMSIILQGYMEGVDAHIYADPKYDSIHMRQALDGLEKGLNIEDIQRYLNNPSLTYSEMENICTNLADGNMTENDWKKIERSRDQFKDVMTGNTKIQKISEWQLYHYADILDSYSEDVYYIYTDKDTFRLFYRKADNKYDDFNDEYTLEIKLDSPGDYCKICEGFADTHKAHEHVRPDFSSYDYRHYGQEEYYACEQCLDFINMITHDFDHSARVRSTFLTLPSDHDDDVKVGIDFNTIDASAFDESQYTINDIPVFSSDNTDIYAGTKALRPLAEFCEEHKEAVLKILETEGDKNRKNEISPNWQTFEKKVYDLINQSEAKDESKTSDESEHKGRNVTSKMESITEEAKNTETDTDNKEKDSPAD